MSDKERISADVPQELKQWYVNEAAKSGIATSALMAMVLLDHKVKKETEK